MYKFKIFISLTSLILFVLLFSSSSLIQAAKFGDNVAVSSESTDELHPDIAVDHAGNIFITWEAATTGWDIKYKKSQDSGATFTSASTINSTTVPAAGAATLTNVGGSIIKTLRVASSLYAQSIDLTDVTGIPSSGTGSIEGDEFTYTGIAATGPGTIGLLTGIPAPGDSNFTSSTGLTETHDALKDVAIYWSSGSPAIGNGSLTVSYVGPWTSTGTVTVTYSGSIAEGGTDTWAVSGAPTSTTEVGSLYSFPVAGTDPDSYAISFSISTTTAWGAGDRFTFAIAAVSSSAYQILPAITADDNQISYFTWTDTRVATSYYDVYADQTGLYTGDKYISKMTALGPTYDHFSTVENASDIAVEKFDNVKQVYTVWAEGDATGTHIWSRTSTDEGQTFSGQTLSNTGTRVDKNEGTDICIHPSLGVIGRNDDNVRSLYVVFHNYTDDIIRYTSSANGGTDWGDAIPVSALAAGVAQPDIAVSDTDANGTPDIYAVWRQSASGTDNIYFARLPAGEAAFTTPVRINASTDKVQDSPSITVNPTNGNLYVVWRDEKTGESDIYFSQSFDSGANWGVDLNDDGDVSDSGESIDLVVNDDTAYAVQNHPSIVADAYGHVYVVWEDARSGSSYDIYLARLVSGTFAGGPAAPTSLSAVGSDGCAALTWTASTSADIVSYSLYRSTTRGSWSSTATATGIVNPNYMDTGVTNGTAYWYAVTATNASSQESGYSNDARATPNVYDTTAPSAPTSLSALPASTQASLSWTAPSDSDLSTYHIYRSSASGTSYCYVDVVTSPAAWYLDTSLTNGTTYYYVVTALDTSNNESADSNEVYVTPPSGYGTGTGTPPSPAPGEAEDGIGGGCFIATACYGSSLTREVRVLSKFRDECLLGNSLGRVFVSGYCRVSPLLAEFICEKPLLRFLARVQLKPWVKIAHFFNENA